MISNQANVSSPAANAFGGTPTDGAKPAAAESGAASAFAALLGQLYQPVPQPASQPVATAVVPTDGDQAATEETTNAEVSTADGTTPPAAAQANATADQQGAIAPSVLPPSTLEALPAQPPVFTPRAPRSVTAAIGSALKSRGPAIELEARFAALKTAGAGGTTLKRAAGSRDDEQAIVSSDDPVGNAATQAAGAVAFATALAQVNVTAPDSKETATSGDSSEPPAQNDGNAAAPTASTSGSAATGAAANGGLGAASPMVRAMTMLLDALGVTDRKGRNAGEEVTVDTSKGQTAKPVDSSSLVGGVNVDADASRAPVIALPAAQVQAKLDAPAEPAVANKNVLPGAIVTQTPGDNSPANGQGGGHDRHDSRESLHRLHADAGSAAASSDQGVSGWSGTLGGALRLGMAATETSELAKAGTAGHVAHSEPNAAPTSTSQVTMDLDPAVGLLGKIRVAVRGDAVHATITTQDNDAAAMGLRAHELRQALEQRGFSDARVTVRTSGTDEAPSSVIASSITELKPRVLETSSSSKSDQDHQQQPRGERRDQTGGDRSDTRRQRNRQEQNA